MTTPGANDPTITNLTPSTNPATAPTMRTTLPNIPDVQLECELGRGGMGVVYRGTQSYIDRRVAVKLLISERAEGDQDYIKRFQREAKLLAGLSHPNIVACYHAGLTADGHCFLVMEFIDGPNLASWIKEHGPLAEGDALKIIRDMADALEHARQVGIIHRDVKAENILLQKRDQPGAFPFVAKLADLGLARPTTDGDMRLTKPGVIMGSPSSMAPEQFDDPESVDFRADIYGLGCVLFRSLTGKDAYTGTSFSQLLSQKVNGPVPDPCKSNSTISKSTSTLVRSLLQPDKNARPKSYEEVMERCAQVAKAKTGLKIAVLALIVLGVLGLFIANRVFRRAAHQAAPRAEQKQPLAAVEPAAKIPSSPPAQALEFTVRLPLFRDSGSYLQDWSPATSSWGRPEERGVLAGYADDTARIARAMRSPPWKIAGSFLLDGDNGFSEARIEIALAGDKSMALVVQDVGTYLASLVSDGNDVKQTPKRLSAGTIPFTIAATADSLTVAINGEAFKSEPIAEPKGLALVVKNGRLCLETLDLFVPAP